MPYSLLNLFKMKKRFLFVFLFIIATNCFSQITYEKGYYITESGEKVEGFIKNTDWQNNPTKFTFKTSETANPEIKTAKSIKEFGVYGVNKYIKRTVKYDKSSNSIGNLNYNKEINLAEEELLLQVLIEGVADLFVYRKEQVEKFFYKTQSNDIKPLIYKKYLDPENSIKEINSYKNQLWNNLKCDPKLTEEIKKTKYYRKDLTNLFKSYNQCKNANYNDFFKSKRKSRFMLNLRAGVRNSSLSVEHYSVDFKNVDFDNKLGVRLGIEAEFILPFKKNKWSVFFEPTYQNYKSEKRLTDPDQIAKVNYSSIEIPLGLRYYMFLNKNSKLFLNGALILDFPQNSDITFERSENLAMSERSNFVFGLGYNYNSKYSIELRFHTYRNIIGNYTLWDSKYKSMSLIFGYTLF